MKSTVFFTSVPSVALTLKLVGVPVVPARTAGIACVFAPAGVLVGRLVLPGPGFVYGSLNPHRDDG